MDALSDIPELDGPLKTKKGLARLQKTDIFRKIMWFSYDTENSWHPIATKRVKEIVKMNKSGRTPENLIDDDQLPVEDVALNSDLERMDKKYKKSNSKRRKKRRRPKNNPRK
jgi:hypothetical protein